MPKPMTQIAGCSDCRKLAVYVLVGNGGDYLFACEAHLQPLATELDTDHAFTLASPTPTKGELS